MQARGLSVQDSALDTAGSPLLLMGLYSCTVVWYLCVYTQHTIQHLAWHCDLTLQNNSLLNNNIQSFINIVEPCYIATTAMVAIRFVYTNT